MYSNICFVWLADVAVFGLSFISVVVRLVVIDLERLPLQSVLEVVAFHTLAVAGTSHLIMKAVGIPPATGCTMPVGVVTAFASVYPPGNWFRYLAHSVSVLEFLAWNTEDELCVELRELSSCVKGQIFRFQG